MSELPIAVGMVPNLRIQLFTLEPVTVLGVVGLMFTALFLGLVARRWAIKVGAQVPAREMQLQEAA
jgi:hypothetical protein